MTTATPPPTSRAEALCGRSTTELIRRRMSLLELIPELRADGHIDLAEQCVRARDQIAAELERRSAVEDEPVADRYMGSGA